MNNKKSNSEMMAFNMRVLEIGAVKINIRDPNALDRIKLRTGEYYNLCFENDLSPTWEGLALALGVCRDTLSKWRDGISEWTRNGVSEYIQLQWSFLNNYHAQSMLDGNSNVVAGIFIGRNNFGYKNDDEKIVTHEVNVHWSTEQLLEQAQNLQNDKYLTNPE